MSRHPARIFDQVSGYDPFELPWRRAQQR